MPDKQPFNPHKPQKMVMMSISVREAKVLNYMRKSEFGKFMIHKAAGIITRIEPQTSLFVEEDDSLEL